MRLSLSGLISYIFRNVFWRTIGLLKQKVVPVFVLEGAVSSLKEEMLQKRHPETLIMCRNTSSRSKFSNPSQEVRLIRTIYERLVEKYFYAIFDFT